MVLELSPLFSQGAVIQAQQPVPVWGWAEPCSSVTVGFEHADTVQVQADAHGAWSTRLAACEPGGPYTLHVHSGSEHTTSQLYAGEVYILAGQSNMEFTMESLRWRYPGEFMREPDPLLRHCKVPVAFDFHKPQRRFAQEVQWHTANSHDIGEFSAVGYFFGRMLRQRHNVPVGLLNITLGGSPVESWMDAQTLQHWQDAVKTLQPYLDDDYAQQRITSTVEAGHRWYQNLQLDTTDAIARQDTAQSLEYLPQQLQWQPITLPALISQTCPLFAQYKGSMYLRRTVIVPQYVAGEEAVLHAGTMVDSDVTWVNGVQVGASEHQYLSRDYLIPQGTLHAGVNTILIRLVSERGTARVTPDKPMVLCIGDEHIDLRGQWQIAAGTKAESSCPEEDFVRWKPLGLYNAMVAPCAGFPVRGVLWYQGESNTGWTADSYANRLADMIHGWRQAWQQDRLPFIVVQLPEFSIDGVEDGGWPTVRDQLRQLTHDVPDTAVAIGLGSGEYNDLHPWNKACVAERLYMQAQRLVYADTSVADNPTIVAARYDATGSQIIVTIDGGADLQLSTLDGRAPGEFVVQWDDGSCSALPAEIISPATVAIAAPYRRATHIRYAWRNAPSQGLLCNQLGVPVSPAIISIQ